MKSDKLPKLQPNSIAPINILKKMEGSRHIQNS
jgi:hypothetical protein